jgi:hypothetical protein
MWIWIQEAKLIRSSFSLLVTKKFNFLWKNDIMWVKHSYVGEKAFLKGWESDLFVKFPLLLDLDPHFRF